MKFQSSQNKKTCDFTLTFLNWTLYHSQQNIPPATILFQPPPPIVSNNGKKRLDWALFVLLFLTLVYFPSTAYMLFLFIFKFSIFTELFCFINFPISQPPPLTPRSASTTSFSCKATRRGTKAWPCRRSWTDWPWTYQSHSWASWSLWSSRLRMPGSTLLGLWWGGGLVLRDGRCQWGWGVVHNLHCSFVSQNNGMWY